MPCIGTVEPMSLTLARLGWGAEERSLVEGKQLEKRFHISRGQLSWQLLFRGKFQIIISLVSIYQILVCCHGRLSSKGINANTRKPSVQGEAAPMKAVLR